MYIIRKKDKQLAEAKREEIFRWIEDQLKIQTESS